MISDVPVGVLEWRGSSSHSTAKLCSRGNGQGHKYVYDRFENEQFVDERKYAEIAAKKFGTRHYDMTINASEFARVLSVTMVHGRASMRTARYCTLLRIPARKKTCQGSFVRRRRDGAFAGYPDYRNLVWLERLKKLAGPLSPIFGQAVSLLTNNKPLRRFNKYGHLIGMNFSNYYYSRSSNPLAFMNKSAEQFFTPEFHDVMEGKAHSFRDLLLRNINDQELLDKMLYIYMKTWLVDDLPFLMLIRSRWRIR